MKQLIFYILALIFINTIAKSHDYDLKKPQESKKLNEKPIHKKQSRNYELAKPNKMKIIEQYREYAFATMQPTTQVFLAEYPDDPKSKTIERYLLQLSFAATMYKFCHLLKCLPEINEIEKAYIEVPPNPFVYHIIVHDEIVENENQLPYYEDDFDARQAWKTHLNNLEEQIRADFQKTHLKALSLQTN